MFRDLPKALRVLRESRSLTQDQLAARVRQVTGGRHKLTASRLSLWERGAAKPSLESLGALLTALDSTLTELDAVLRGEPLVDEFIADYERRMEGRLRQELLQELDAALEPLRADVAALKAEINPSKSSRNTD